MGEVNSDKLTIRMNADQWNEFRELEERFKSKYPNRDKDRIIMFGTALSILDIDNLKGCVASDGRSERLTEYCNYLIEKWGL